LKKYIDKEEPFDDVPRIFEDINGLVFHSTSENGLELIVKDQEIRAFNGTFPARWPIAKDSTTYGSKYNYVCLFDFQSCSPIYSLRYPSQWVSVVLAHEPFCFFIVVDKEKINHFYVENKVAVNETNCMMKFILFVETWSRKPIPLSAFKKICMLQTFMRNENYLIEEADCNDSLIFNIKKYKEKIISRYNEEYLLWKETDEMLKKFRK